MPAFSAGPPGATCWNKHALRYAISLQERACPIRIRRRKLHADRTARNFAGLDNAVVDFGCGVDRHGKPDALIAARTGGDGRVDPDHFAANIQQRAAAVAGIDGRVGLQEVLELGRVARNIALLRADDTRGDGRLEPEWGTDGYGPIAYFNGFRVADLGRRQVPFAFHANHS